MPKSVVSTDKIATLQALADAEAQSFNRDSPEPGSSGVTSFEEDQYVDVLFHAFPATVILEELLDDRGQATELVRSRLASQNPPYACSDEAWKTILEPRAWEFLVHQEFKARGVKDFEWCVFAFKLTRPRRSCWTPAPRTQARPGQEGPAASAFTQGTSTAFAKTC
jgi:hypothetical protein